MSNQPQTANMNSKDVTKIGNAVSKGLRELKLKDAFAAAVKKMTAPEDLVSHCCDSTTRDKEVIG